MKNRIILIVGVLVCSLAYLFYIFLIDGKGYEDVGSETEAKYFYGNPAAKGLAAQYKKIDTLSSFSENKEKNINENAAGRQENPLDILEKRIGFSFQESYSLKRYQDKRTTRDNLLSVIKGGGSSYRLMEFSRGIGALIAMFEVTGSDQYLREVLDLTEQLISKAKAGKMIENNPDIFKDDYLGWANINRSGNGTTGEHLKEYSLHESYLYRYLAKTVYLIKGLPSDPKNDLRQRAEKLQRYIDKNGWEKWFVRGEKTAQGCFPYLFRNRTHMTSHWGIVALYMREITEDPERTNQYNEFLTSFDKQLKDNFRLEGGAYIWNMTWDSAWPFEKHCNPGSKISIIQDVSHGNHVVNYIIDSYNLSKGTGNWTLEDIKYLCNTFRKLIYDRENQRFNADLNSRFLPNMADGLHMSDGFIKLARYDRSILNSFKDVKDRLYNEKSFNFYEAQYVAELLLAEKVTEK